MPDDFQPPAAIMPAPVFEKPANMVKIYCDGLSQLMIGYPVSRLTLHDLVERDASNPGTPEVRHLVAELVMPTAGLVEMARHILAGANLNREAMLKIETEYTGRLHAALDAVTLVADAEPAK